MFLEAGQLLELEQKCTFAYLQVASMIISKQSLTQKYTKDAFIIYPISTVFENKHYFES